METMESDPRQEAYYEGEAKKMLETNRANGTKYLRIKGDSGFYFTSAEKDEFGKPLEVGKELISLNDPEIVSHLVKILKNTIRPL